MLGGAAAYRIGDRGLRSGGFSGRFVRCKRDRAAIARNVAAVRADVRRPSLPTVEGVKLQRASWRLECTGRLPVEVLGEFDALALAQAPNVVLGETRQRFRILVVHAAMPWEGQPGLTEAGSSLPQEAVGARPAARRDTRAE
jgi:hypothetical protein